jgi:hypothetical protein
VNKHSALEFAIAGSKNLGGSRRQLAQERLRPLQVARVKTLGEPSVDRSEKIESLIPLALTAPQPRHAYCRAQLVDLASVGWPY